MIKTKIAAIGLSLAMVLGAAAPVGAVTIAELQAQINALMAQLSALQGGASVSSSACAFTRSLTVGSQGADVTCLQNYLTGTGHFTFAGGATGYFGPITRTAVAAWQAANGVAPAVGYFGPISQAKFSAMVGVGGTVPGTTVGATTGSTAGITTPGAEGTITVSKNPNPASGTKMYEGDMKRSVLGIKIEAKGSDMKIERVKIDMDHVTGTTVADQNFYNKIASKIYVMDGSTVLASSDLNSTTVVKDGSDYFITLAGFSFIVPKDSIKVLDIAVDGKSTWDSDYNTETWSLGVPVDGVRSLSGAGINQYGPSAAFSNSFTTEDDVADSATLTASTPTNTPQDQERICISSSSEDECDRLELLKVNLKAEKDDVLLTDVVVNISKTDAGTASSSAAYLYDGSTLVGSATTMNFSGQSSVTFTDIDYKILKDQTKTLSFQVDVVDNITNPSVWTASTTAANLTAENMKGTGITESGNGLGESITTRKAGPEFTLKSKSITYGGAPGFAGATTTAKADFVITMKAVGADIEFGDSASTTYPLVVLGTPNGDTASSSVIYRGGAAVSGTRSINGLVYVASSTSITVPSGVTASTGANSWILGEGNTVDIAISMVFNSRTGESTATIEGPADITTGAYAVQINRLLWSTVHAGGGREISSFMNGNADWRTGTVTLP
ncbi:MAG TPA: peptidoglycan-binding domain-containing protein [Candidatus Paceibacterota bacterium]